MNITLEMTLDEVMEATREAERGGMSYSHPHLPLAKWYALHKLIELERCFNDGDQFSAMLAIRICAARELPVPGWAAKVYIAGFDSIHTFRAKSWDEVFPVALEKGAHLNRAREAINKRWAVLNEISRRRRAGQPIDEILFANVGKDLGLGKTRVSELYYSFPPDWRELP